MTRAGALQEAVSEQYNDQLRELREAGLAEESGELRQVAHACCSPLVVCGAC